MLRMFSDPLLDVLGKLGTNAYLPVQKADRCLQLLVALLHAGAPRGPRAPDGEEDGFPRPLLGVQLAFGAKGSSRPFKMKRLPHAFGRCPGT